MICIQCGQTNDNNEPISNMEGRITQDKSTLMSGYCSNCLTDAFPFCNISDHDFFNVINLKYNLHEHIITRIQSCNFNPFSLNSNCDIHADNDIDPDSNKLLKYIYEDNCKYYIEESFSELIQQNNINGDLSLLHLNIRSLKNKHDDLCHYLAQLNLTFSIIGLTETWLLDNCDDTYNIPTHSLVTKSRKNKAGGGVGIFIANNINFVKREELSTFKEGIFESICIEIQLCNKRILIGVIYRPPGNKIKEFEETFEHFLLGINREKKQCYLMGDFNIDTLKIGQNTLSDNFMNQLLSSSFYPLITKPTRITQNSATLIDNILTNSFDRDNVNGVLFSDLSDHLPVFTIEIGNRYKEMRPITLSRDTRKENIDRLIDKLGKTNWEELEQEWDPDICYDKFYNNFFKVYDECIPKKKVSSKQLKIQKKTLDY